MTYVAILIELTQYCQFDDTLNDMLKDRLVCGINNEQLQRRLLSESQLTFKKALQISQTFETEVRDTKDWQEGPRPMAPFQRMPGQYECYHCGGQNNPSTCRHKETVGHNCGRKSHLAKHKHPVNSHCGIRKHTTTYIMTDSIGDVMLTMQNSDVMMMFKLCLLCHH